MMWRNDAISYGWVSIALHWVVGILFLCQLPLGYFTQVVEGHPASQNALYGWHEALGFLVLAFAVPRFVWAVLSRSPALPESVTDSERSAAAFAHLVLYALSVLVPLAGWASMSAAPTLMVMPFLAVPRLPVAVSGDSAAVWSSLHAFLAYGAGFLAAVHILAALRHHFRFRDDVMIRMLHPQERVRPPKRH